MVRVKVGYNQSVDTPDAEPSQGGGNDEVPRVAMFPGRTGVCENRCAVGKLDERGFTLADVEKDNLEGAGVEAGGQPQCRGENQDHRGCTRLADAHCRGAPQEKDRCGAESHDRHRGRT